MKTRFGRQQQSGARRITGALGNAGGCASSLILTVSASQEAVSRKACRAGNGGSLSKRHNAADERFLARPQGASPRGHCCVAILGKGMPFPADRALH